MRIDKWEANGKKGKIRSGSNGRRIPKTANGNGFQIKELLTNKTKNNMTPQTKERLTRLLTNDFDDIPNKPWTEEILFEVIETAYEIGLPELGNELELRLHSDQRRRFLNLKSA
ncbi:MAG TPA: hypothetical protein VFM82_02765 [Flavobacteriaceae bacterium]|nr:hypothetical protein [Flavobacteriaceae bacterium]